MLPRRNTNNEERNDSTISLESYTSERMQTQMRLTFGEGLGNTDPAVQKPNQLVSGEPLTITISGDNDSVKYYVYGMGELEGIYDRAGYAIQRAQQVSGVVISSDQAYVWETGNRDLAYSTDAAAFLIALTDASHAILLTGYTRTDITYIDPDTGGVYTVGVGDMESMVSGSGNTFIGYIPS